MRTPLADRYWEQFVQSLPSTAPRPAGYVDATHFGETNEDATQIAALVLAGIKTATGSLPWVYEAEGQPQPQPGDFWVILDSDDQPVCIVETTEVEVKPYDEADERFAYDGGERDRTLASWREMYWSYICSECARISREPSSKTPLVYERFRVAYSEPLREAV